MNPSSFCHQALTRFKGLLLQQQPHLQEVQQQQMHLFKWKGEQVALFNTYGNTVQLILFHQPGKGAAVVYEYSHGATINWPQIEGSVNRLIHRLPLNPATIKDQT